MRVRGVRLAGTAAAVLMLTGCGQQAGTPVLDSAIAVRPASPAPGTAPASKSASAIKPSLGIAPSRTISLAPAPVPDASPTAQRCSNSGVTVTNADNGKTLCMRQGGVVLVLLSDASGDIRAAGPLTPQAEILPMITPGVKSAAFAATRPGTATITSVLSPCADGPGLHCMMMTLFRVKIRIAG